MKTKTAYLIAGGTVLAFLIVMIIVGWLLLHPGVEYIQGEIEATQIDVAAKISGRIDAVYVDRGQQVAKGQLLASLDSPEIRAKLKQASAAQRAAGSQREKADSGTREEEIRQARNAWLRSRYAAELAETTYRRIERLYRDGVVPAQRRDEAEAQFTMAKSAAAAAKAAYDMALRGARQEDKVTAKELENQASAVVDEVHSYLDETRLLAPVAGEVAEKVVDPGELVSPGYPVITLVDLRDVWVTFNLREDKLAKIRMGDTIIGEIPALGKKRIRFVVHYISPLGDFATWRATSAQGDFDLKTFEVRARPTVLIKGLRPGMSVLVEEK